MQPENYLKIDYKYLPSKVHVYNKGVLVKKWSEKEPIELVNQVIDGMDESVFKKIKMKRAPYEIIQVFEPKSIKIVQKD